MTIDKTPRIPIPDYVRDYVFDRDGHRCQHCGETNRAKLTIDHIVALARGGSNDISNLRTLCRCCNSRKGDRLDPHSQRYYL